MARQREWLLWGAVAAVLVGFALWQLPTPNGDLAQYRCFALAFWRGGAGSLGVHGCAARLPHGPFPPLRMLPREYPPLALVPFSLPLLFGGAASMTPYVLAFNVLMLACLGATAWLLRPTEASVPAGTDASRLYLVWLAIGATTIALVRYDAVPALLTTAALVRARRGPALAPYALLALGTLLKLYPALPLALLALWDWRRGLPPPSGRGVPRPSTAATPSTAAAPSTQPRPSTRWTGLPLWVPGVALAAGIMAGIQLVADVLAGVGGVPWLGVQGGRPPQIESSAAGLLWLLRVGTGRAGTLRVVSVERALAFSDPLGTHLAQATLALALVGVAWAAWNLARGRRPERAMAGGLLALLAGASIFSPQYLLWASPLVALAVAGMRARADSDADGGARREGARGVVLAWSIACLCTTILYSVGYLKGWPLGGGAAFALFMALIVARDALVWYTAYLLLRARRWPLAWAVFRSGWYNWWRVFGHSGERPQRATARPRQKIADGGQSWASSSKNSSGWGNPAEGVSDSSGGRRGRNVPRAPPRCSSRYARATPRWRRPP